MNVTEKGIKHCWFFKSDSNWLEVSRSEYNRRFNRDEIVAKLNIYSDEDGWISSVNVKIHDWRGCIVDTFVTDTKELFGHLTKHCPLILITAIYEQHLNALGPDK